MALTDAERQERRRRKLGMKPRGQLQPCGTAAAARRHRRNGEPMCDACRTAAQAENKYYSELRRSNHVEGAGKGSK